MYVCLCVYTCVRASVSVFVLCVRACTCVVCVCAGVGLSQGYATDIQIHPKYIPPSTSNHRSTPPESTSLILSIPHLSAVYTHTHTHIHIHKQGVTQARFGRGSGSVAVTSSYDDTCKVLDVTTGNLLHTIRHNNSTGR